MMFRILKLMAILLFVPVFGYGIAETIDYKLYSGLNKSGKAPRNVTKRICTQKAPVNNPLYTKPYFCDDWERAQTLKIASLGVAAAGFVLPGLFWLLAYLAGEKRRRMAQIFPPLVRTSLFILAFLSLAQGLLVGYTVYIGELFWLEKYHLVLLGFIGFATLGIFALLIKNAVTLGGKNETRVAGNVLDPEKFQKIHQVVGILAQQLGARPPDNIVAGLDPTFFVTSARVHLPELDKPLEGETLFLSLPLCRLFSLPEFTAVVGHELGHFRGDDTAYSLKFAPVYAGLGSAIHAIGGEDGNSPSLLAMPALGVLNFMYWVFANKEAAVSRDRELAADKAATEISSAQALGTALIKVAMFGWLWDHIQRDNIDRLNQGLITRNLSMAFANTVKYDIDHDQVGVGIHELLEVEIPHPTDSHPTIRARLMSLLGHVPDFSMADLRVPQENAILVFGDCQPIEEDLTVLEHRIMVGAGIVTMPNEQDVSEEQKFDQSVLNAVYSLTAALVTADGQIDAREIEVAEGICQQFLPNFYPLDFREYCYHPDQIPAPADAAHYLADVTTADGRDLIVRLLTAISEADNLPSPSEHQIINTVKGIFSQIQA